MTALETLVLHSLRDNRFFESLSGYQPEVSHLVPYRSVMPGDWDLRQRGLWFIARPPVAPGTPPQGWKIHVSAPVGRSVEALAAALPVLRDAGVLFKFLVDEKAVAWTTGKMFPRGASGKMITVYPADDAQFVELAKSLAQELAEIDGPYILSDRRVPGSKSVFYRYGGFESISELTSDGSLSLMIRNPDGTRSPDIRHPYWSPPAWVEDPLAVEDTAPSEPTLADGRFTVTAAMQHRNTGGVYRAIDTLTGADVVIKEARPHVVVGRSLVPATTMLEREYRILRRLEDTGHFVRPIAFFTEWEHSFLVEEFVGGPAVSQHSIRTNPVLTRTLDADRLRTYLTSMQAIWMQIAEAIRAAHEQGVVLADLSFTNVLVRESDGRVIVIDVEAAIEVGVDEPVGLVTPGMSSPGAVWHGVVDEANDYHTLGMMMLGHLAVVNSTIGYHRPALRTFLDALAADLDLPAPFVALIEDLVGGGPHDPDAVAYRLAALDFADPGYWQVPIPLTRPAAEILAGERGARLAERVEETVEGIRRFLIGTADASRTDRLFPADPAVFATNPLSIAYGAAGVLYALSRLPSPDADTVPEPLLSWLLAQNVADEDYPPGLMIGQAGIAWVLDELGQHEYALDLIRRAGHHPLLAADRHDVMGGRAGHGLACLHLWQRHGAPDLLAAALGDVRALARTAMSHADGAYWPREDARTPLGYLHGGSGVALFLLMAHLATGDAQAKDLATAAMAFEVAHLVSTDTTLGFPAEHTDADPATAARLVVYWDSGNAGVASALLRFVAAGIDPDGRFSTVCAQLLLDARRKYAVMPQQFHGLAGVGNLLLDAWELTGDPVHRDEAWRLAEGVLHFAIPTAEGIAFLGEQSVRECADYASGAAGVGLFLARLRTAAPGAATSPTFVVDSLLRRA